MVDFTWHTCRPTATVNNITLLLFDVLLLPRGRHDFALAAVFPQCAAVPFHSGRRRRVHVSVLRPRFAHLPLEAGVPLIAPASAGTASHPLQERLSGRLGGARPNEVKGRRGLGRGLGRARGRGRGRLGLVGPFGGLVIDQQEADIPAGHPAHAGVAEGGVSVEVLQLRIRPRPQEYL
eukprot:613769-Prorocentrum_minimum.AAC.1